MWVITWWMRPLMLLLRYLFSVIYVFGICSFSEASECTGGWPRLMGIYCLRNFFNLQMLILKPKAEQVQHSANNWALQADGVKMSSPGMSSDWEWYFEDFLESCKLYRQFYKWDHMMYFSLLSVSFKIVPHAMFRTRAVGCQPLHYSVFTMEKTLQEYFKCSRIDCFYSNLF